MLILTRRLREVVMIGADIQVTVLGIDGDRIRLGVTAPSELNIVRQELKTSFTPESQLEASPLTTQPPASSP